MKKIHLLNAAVMPHQGVYVLEKITTAEFKKSVIEADAAGTLEHYIGYDNTLELIEIFTGVHLGDTTVAQTEFENGDRFLVIRFWRRLNRDEKVRTMSPDARLTVEDFEFFSGTYYKSVEGINGK